MKSLLVLSALLLLAACASTSSLEKKAAAIAAAKSPAVSFLKCAGLSQLSTSMNKKQKTDYFGEAQYAQIADLGYDPSTHSIEGNSMMVKLSGGALSIFEQMPVSFKIDSNESSSETRILAQLTGKGTLSKTNITGLRLIATESAQGVILYAVDPTNIVRPIGQRCEIHHDILNQILTK